MPNPFLEHPREVKMSYGAHLRFALWLSYKTASCALASLIHAFFPFWFTTHTSRTVKRLQIIFEGRLKKKGSID